MVVVRCYRDDLELCGMGSEEAGGRSGRQLQCFLWVECQNFGNSDTFSLFVCLFVSFFGTQNKGMV